MEKISFVVPCYNEVETIPLFYQEMEKINYSMKKVQFEYIFVDDGSKDKSLEEIRKLSIKDRNVKYISFSRNFGKEAAMYAGLENSTGDYVTIIDADLQDPSFLIPEMYHNIKDDGYDCVGIRRVSRKGEPVIRSFFSRMFYQIINKMSKTEMISGARDFRLMTRQMVDSILQMKEYNRYSKGLFSFVGFKTKWLEYENIERVAGSTKFNFWKLFIYAIDGISAFSTGPLIFSAVLGILFCLVSFLAILFIIIRTLCFGDPVSGWPSMICIMFFLSGIHLFCMGIVGFYLSKMYMEIKDRPIYITKETNIKR